MPILLATTNVHKVQEIRAVWAGLAATAEAATVPALLDLGALGDRRIDPPVEDQPTFDANAWRKAGHYASATALACLADDSGLEVDALGGRPGVHSARFAGATGPRHLIDAANIRHLLELLGDVPAPCRTARFVCAMCLCGPPASAGAEPPVLAAVRGSVAGRILTRQEAGPEGRGRGAGGFGYDPIFLIGGSTRTAAELAPAEKNLVSHRAHAARLMWRALLELRARGQLFD